MSNRSKEATTTYRDSKGNTLRWTSHPGLASDQFIPVPHNGLSPQIEVSSPHDAEYTESVHPDTSSDLGTVATDYTLALLERDDAEASANDPDNESTTDEDLSRPYTGEMVTRLGVVIGEVADDGTNSYIDHSHAAPKQPQKRKKVYANGQPVLPHYRDDLRQRPLGRTTDPAEQAAHVLEVIDSHDDEQARDAAHIRKLVSLLKHHEADVRRVTAEIAELEQRPELLDYKAEYHALSSKKSYLRAKLLEAHENGDYSSETAQRIDAQIRGLQRQLAVLERQVYEPTIQPIEEQIAGLYGQQAASRSEKRRVKEQLEKLFSPYKHLTGDYEYNESGKLVRASAPQEHGSASASHRTRRGSSKSTDARDVRYFGEKHRGGAWANGDEDGEESFDVLADDTPYPLLRPDDAAELRVPDGTVWTSDVVEHGGSELLYGDWDDVPELDFLLKPNRGTDPIAYVDGYDPQENDFELEGSGFYVTNRP